MSVTLILPAGVEAIIWYYLSTSRRIMWIARHRLIHYAYEEDIKSMKDLIRRFHYFHQSDYYESLYYAVYKKNVDIAGLCYSLIPPRSLETSCR